MNGRWLAPTFTAALFLLMGTDVLADCFVPHSITAETSTVLNTSTSSVRAPGAAGIYKSAGEICFRYSVRANAWIESAGNLVASATATGSGEVLVTATGTATSGNCYTSSIDASGGDLVHPTWTDSGECWYGPPDEEGSGCGYTGVCEQASPVR